MSTESTFSPVLRLSIVKTVIYDKCVCGMNWCGQRQTVVVKIPSIDFITQHVNEYGLIDSKTKIKLNSEEKHSLHFSKGDLCPLGLCVEKVWPNTLEECTCIQGWNIISGEILFNNVKEPSFLSSKYT